MVEWFILYEVCHYIPKLAYVIFVQIYYFDQIWNLYSEEKLKKKKEKKIENVY